MRPYHTATPYDYEVDVTCPFCGDTYPVDADCADPDAICEGCEERAFQAQVLEDQMAVLA